MQQNVLWLTPSASDAGQCTVMQEHRDALEMNLRASIKTFAVETYFKNVLFQQISL